MMFSFLRTTIPCALCIAAATTLGSLGCAKSNQTTTSRCDASPACPACPACSCPVDAATGDARIDAPAPNDAVPDSGIADSADLGAQSDAGTAWLEGLVGFATVNAWDQEGTTGGLGGPTVTARTADEFRWHIEQDGPLVIQVEGTITLPTATIYNGAPAYGMHFVSSNKTIIGIGKNPTIRSGGFGLGQYPFDDNVTSPPKYAVRNIIIRNLIFDGTGGVLGETDGINVFMFTHHVWIDHCTFRNSQDGSVDIKRGASYITVSNNLFEEAPEACMLGHADGSLAEAQDFGNLKVTYHHNWYKHCVGRMPLVRFGEAHVYNNYWSDVVNYAIGIAQKGSIFSENNYLDPSDEGVLDADVGGGAFSAILGEEGSLKDVGSLGGSSHNEAAVLWEPRAYYIYAADPTPLVKDIVMAEAGAGKLEF